MLRHARAVRVLALTAGAALAACAPSAPETADSPVQTVNRSQERIVQSDQSYTRRGEDGTVVARVLAPAPQVWEALKATFEARKINLTILDRAAGRMGDTAAVFTHNWAGKPGSFYFSCGETITGQRSNEDRIRAIILAQLSRLKSDTIAIALHMSGYAVPVSMGGSAATAQCSSTGRGESDFLDEVVSRLGMGPVQKGN